MKTIDEWWDYFGTTAHPSPYDLLEDYAVALQVLTKYLQAHESTIHPRRTMFLTSRETHLLDALRTALRQTGEG